MVTPTRETPADVLEALASAIQGAIGDDLAGLYVYGSYLAGGFDPEGSDLDLVAVLEREVDAADLATLGSVHDDLVRRYPAWANRLDVVFIGRESLRDFRSGRGSFAVISPGEPFRLRTDVADWLQSWYLLRETSQRLVGMDVTELVPPIPRADFIAALVGHAELMRRRSREEQSPGALAYELLTTCRVLQTVSAGVDPSKAEAADWVRQRWPMWAPVIDSALACRHSGGRLGFDNEASRDEARQFIDVLAGEVVAARNMASG